LDTFILPCRPESCILHWDNFTFDPANRTPFILQSYVQLPPPSPRTPSYCILLTAHHLHPSSCTTKPITWLFSSLDAFITGRLHPAATCLPCRETFILLDACLHHAHQTPSSCSSDAFIVLIGTPSACSLTLLTPQALTPHIPLAVKRYLNSC
jgi:hypothetical protein